ncbi:hyoscyamine 6-dioxygenase-like [Silene latifolia]|uniref:hyoscyamine 6-dioxygenase-like n=1 Tax=Silene latifolia TaxID=37657 RepID=UPI003D76BE18
MYMQNKQIMKKLVSTWADGKTLPDNYVFPPGKRPGDHVVPTSQSIPVIDFSKSKHQDRNYIVQQIVQASQHFGFFQVINHGVPRKLMEETRRVLKEFFELPGEEKAKFCSVDLRKKFILFTSSIDYDTEAVHHWRDALRHSCTPIEECKKDWPLTPLNYRKVVGDYVVNLTELGSRILELICEGLGLERGYFEELSQVPLLTVNHYPACPDPSLTLGAGKHCDPNLITILLQDDVSGLQVYNNGGWIGIEPIPDAFVVNIGYQLQIISNGKLRSVEHRVVTNAEEARTTAAFFIGPRNDCRVEPAKAVISPENPAIYKGIQYADLVKTVRAAFTGQMDCALKPHMIET